jgi:hypothetical protein
MTGERQIDVGGEEASRSNRIWQQSPRILILAEDAVLGETLHLPGVAPDGLCAS